MSTWQDIQAVPDIDSAKSDYTYKLLWYNHFKPDTVFLVKTTNLNIGDQLDNEVFEGWCSTFDSIGYDITGKKQVAGDEHFKIDYDPWTQAPYNLPPLTKRWFEILDDERWYIVELKKK